MDSDVEFGFVTPNGLRFCEFIGEGAFGSIASCFCGNEMVAVKQCKGVLKKNKVEVKRMYKEIEILQFFTRNKLGRFFTTLNGTYVNGNDVYLIMKKGETTLNSLEKKSMSTFAKKFILYNIAKSLVILKKAGIVHRDIKEANILVNNFGPIYTAKLCDFGMSDMAQPGKTDNYEVVTLWYRAFELFFSNDNCFWEIDVWSFGCIVYEVMQNEVLFYCNDNEKTMIQTIMSVLGRPHTKRKGINKYLQMIDTKPQNKKFLNLSPKSLDLVSGCVRYDYTKRMSPERILFHNFFDSVRSKENAWTFIEKYNNLPKFESKYENWEVEQTVKEIKMLICN